MTEKKKTKDIEEPKAHLPEGTLCELCHQSIEDDDYQVNPLGFAHKDAACPKAGKDTEDQPQLLHVGGDSDLLDKDGNVVKTHRRTPLRERLGDTQLEDEDTK